MPKIDMVGKKYNFLTVIDDLPPRISRSGYSTRMVLCECECGKIVKVQAQHLRTGNTLSCGCKARDLTTIHKTKHGCTDTRIFRIWQGMKRRCSESAGNSRKYYFDKGIRVCEEWSENFTAFYEWSMENGYSDELTIDRIDNSKGYSPDNCRWADRITQNNNKTDNVIMTHNGETMNLTQWSDRFGIPVHTLICRRYIGWDDEKVLSTPYKPRKRQIGE